MVRRDYIISTKIVAAFGVMILLLILGTAVSVSRLDSLQAASATLASQSGGAASPADEATRRSLDHSYTLIKLLLVVTNIVIIAIALIMALWIAHNVSIPLHEAASFAARVAEGDLSGRPTRGGHDEMGWLFRELRRMTENLREVAVGVHQSSGLLVRTMQDLAQESDLLSERTEEHASSLQQTAASVEELSAAVRENTEHAGEARELTKSAAQVSLAGREIMQQVIATMGAISDSSKKIEDIVGLIDGIAFQTNILALNAAVEAARAGEQGRGFAVVAAEVRSLAQRSAEAAKDIRRLIQESGERVRSGGALVGKAGKAIGDTAQGIQRVAAIIDAIASASREQYSGAEQLNQAITQMDDLTQRNAELASRAAGAVRSIEEETRRLAELVSEFKL